MTLPDRLLTSAALRRLQQAAHDVTGLRLLVLHGSRATGRSGPNSDWDFGYLGDETLDPAGLQDTLTSGLGTDNADLVDLAVATALLRFRAARDGALLYERLAGTFTEFRVAAVRFWCDAGPVIRSAQEAALAGLP